MWNSLLRLYFMFCICKRTELRLSGGLSQTAGWTLPWSQYNPPQPSLQSHCQGSWQVPWRQPGCRAHLSQRSPSQPWWHEHSPGESQKPCSLLQPSAQMADGRRKTGREGNQRKRGKGRKGEEEGEKIAVSSCECGCLKQLPSPSWGL